MPVTLAPLEVVGKGAEGPPVARLVYELQGRGLLPVPAQGPPEPVESAYYDDEVALAVERFQAAQGLPVTGSLDVSTLAALKEPTCNAPLMLTPFESVGEARWPTTDLTWALLAPREADRQVAACLAESLRRWSEACALSFAVSGNEPHLRFAFVGGLHSCGRGFELNAGSFYHAHAFGPQDASHHPPGNVHFNPFRNWVPGDTASPGSISLLSIAVHEVGHALGLRHSQQDPTSVMYDPPSSVFTKRLSASDVEAIQQLYGW